MHFTNSTKVFKCLSGHSVALASWLPPPFILQLHQHSLFPMLLIFCRVGIWICCHSYAASVLLKALLCLNTALQHLTHDCRPFHSFCSFADWHFNSQVWYSARQLSTHKSLSPTFSLLRGKLCWEVSDVLCSTPFSMWVQCKSGNRAWTQTWKQLTECNLLISPPCPQEGFIKSLPFPDCLLGCW